MRLLADIMIGLVVVGLVTWYYMVAGHYYPQEDLMSTRADESAASSTAEILLVVVFCIGLCVGATGVLVWQSFR